MTTTRGLLLAERARARSLAAALDREFAGIAAAASEAGTDDEHDPEGATLAFERQHTAALLTQALEQIAEIDAAIGRLDEGTYGICVRCGQPVGQGRLAARPAAATCIRCAQRKCIVLRCDHGRGTYARLSRRWNSGSPGSAAAGAVPANAFRTDAA